MINIPTNTGFIHSTLHYDFSCEYLCHVELTRNFGFFNQSTHWFHINVHVPVDWVGEEVQFLWDSDSEALVWSVDGVPLQGLTGGGEYECCNW